MQHEMQHKTKNLPIYPISIRYIALVQLLSLGPIQGLP